MNHLEKYLFVKSAAPSWVGSEAMGPVRKNQETVNRLESLRGFYNNASLPGGSGTGARADKTRMLPGRSPALPFRADENDAGWPAGSNQPVGEKYWQGLSNAFQKTYGSDKVIQPSIGVDDKGKDYFKTQYDPLARRLAMRTEDRTRLYDMYGNSWSGADNTMNIYDSESLTKSRMPVYTHEAGHVNQDRSIPYRDNYMPHEFQPTIGETGTAMALGWDPAKLGANKSQQAHYKKLFDLTYPQGVPKDLGTNPQTLVQTSEDINNRIQTPGNPLYDAYTQYMAPTHTPFGRAVQKGGKGLGPYNKGGAMLEHWSTPEYLKRNNVFPGRPAGTEGIDARAIPTLKKQRSQHEQPNAIPNWLTPWDQRVGEK